MAPAAASSKGVIDLVHSDDEEDNRKPAARPRPPQNARGIPKDRNIALLMREQQQLLKEAEVIDLLSSSEDEDDEDDQDDDVMMLVAPSTVPSVARKRSRNEFDASTMDEDLQFAMSLQRQEDEETERYAKSGNHAATRKQSRADRKLAATLQRQEEEEAAKSKAQEQRDMLKTATGKAYAFVAKVLKAVDQVTSLHPPAVAAAASAGGSNFDDGEIEAVAKDDMVFMAEKLFLRQEEFQQGGIDTKVDIGFHYTLPQYFKKIRENGLLTASERSQNALGSHSHGAVFGDGVYTANNCFSFSNFGPIGLLVARLKGTCSAKNYPSLRGAPGNEIHTVIGNKMDPRSDGNGLYDEIVLRKSNQVIPLVRFSRSTSGGAGTMDAGLERLYDVLETVQEVVDEYCNDGIPTPMQRLSRQDYAQISRRSITSGAAAGTNFAASAFNMPPAPPLPPPPPPPPAFNPLPPTMSFAVRPPRPTGMPANFSIAGGMSPSASHGRVKKRRSSRRSSHTTIPGAKIVTAVARIEKEIEYKAPSSLKSESLSNLKKVSPEEVQNLENDSADCAICLCELVEDTQGQSRRERRAAILAQLPCGHVFHRGCILSAMSSLGNRCPYKCAKMIGPPQGKCPSGTMTVTKRAGMHCSGYENDPDSNGTILIQYHIPTSKQMKYHPNPGAKHSGAHRTCYLPDTKEGNELLLRLQYAFRHGLTFTIGTSMTTGQPNSVTWSSIHHKTSFAGGSRSYGFPDPSYFANCNTELDNLNVPSIEELLKA